MAGDLIRTKIAFFSVGEGDGPEQICLLGEDARDLLSFDCFQDDSPEAVGNFTAGGQKRGNEVAAVTDLADAS